MIATKGGLSRPGPDLWGNAASPRHLREACEGSLRRLRIERIDLYQLHAPDPQVPLEASLEALGLLQREGKIRYLGVSNVSADELARARRVVDIVSVQNRYNVKDRTSDDVLTVCERDGLVFIPWYPLATGDYGQLSYALERVAERKGSTVAQVAIAWLLTRSRAMLPIPGTSSVTHLEENMAATSLTLSADDMAELV
jgi:aryl-alcohol dehydrogenase-like predicted oxidoreductase